MSLVEEAQKHLRQRKIDGWLLYDFQGNNPLARRFLTLASQVMTTRRFFYWIPAVGEPVKIVHAIEQHVLDACEGAKIIYSSWQLLQQELSLVLKGVKKSAMEYSPNNAIPYVSCVDAGTVDLIRSFGVEVVSSADFLVHFTSVLSESQIKSHLRAAKAVDQVLKEAWNWIRDRLVQEKKITEYDVQQKIIADFAACNLRADHPPIVAVNGNSADPHYEPTQQQSSLIRKGDWILIDLWAKGPENGAVYADVTGVAVASGKPHVRHQEIFSIVRQAQMAAFHLVRSRFAAQERIEGWEVDESARSVIREAGYGAYFIHRTGHSIETALHGSGTHMDNLEMHDVRPLLPGTCFSIEPGIYLPKEFGVRLEFDVLVHPGREVEISGWQQDQIICLF